METYARITQVIFLFIGYHHQLKALLDPQPLGIFTTWSPRREVEILVNPDHDAYDVQGNRVDWSREYR